MKLVGQPYDSMGIGMTFAPLNSRCQHGGGKNKLKKIYIIFLFILKVILSLKHYSQQKLITMKQKTETYVRERKSLPLLIGMGLIISFLLGYIYSPIIEVKSEEPHYYESKIVPTVKVETVFVEKKEQLSKDLKVYKPIVPSNYEIRNWGYVNRKMKVNELREFLRLRGFRNIDKLTLHKLRRIYLGYRYEDMLMKVHELTDFPLSMLYSFFIIESTKNGIETDLWRIHSNSGGIKSIKGYGYVTYPTREVIRGRNRILKQKFFSGKDTNEGIEVWSKVLNSGRYYECKKVNYDLPKQKLYEKICKCIYENGYHTDRDYKFRSTLMKEFWEIKRDHFPKS